MIRNAVVKMAAQDPSYEQGITAIERQLGPTPVVPEDLDEAIQLLEFVLRNPDKYEEVRRAAIADGIIDESSIPPRFDQTFVVSLLMALYGLQDRLQQKMARGGLTMAARKIASGGQGGDTELVHVNRREAEMLRRMGGSGDVNPNTGLREYKSVRKILGAVLPVVLTVFAPGLGTAIGSALGATGVGASALGGAIIGAGASAIGGGNVLKGALMGGLGGGLGGAVGGATNNALGLGLGQTGQAILGSTLVGAGAGALTGEGVLKGAAQGVLGGAIGELAGMANAPTAFQQGIQAAGRTLGQGLTAGYDPKTAALMGASAGLSRGLTFKPSQTAVSNLREPKNFWEKITAGGPLDTRPDQLTSDVMSGPGTSASTMFAENAPAYTPGPEVAGAAGSPGSNLMTNLLVAGSLASALQGAPPQVQQAISQLSPSQQEYFNRPSVTWDWNRLQSDANASNMSLDQYMASNWNTITSGKYNNPPPAQPPTQPPVQPPGKYRGGALNYVARFAQGAGSGRDDTIDAKLSDGEYVMDAETVALLGDGSSREGAKRLEQMRQNIRKHKGRQMARGKFSPNAKSPLTYLKGVR